MVNWLNSWAQKIIIVVIICTIIEMILPEGKNKKYIKIVIGIYVVFTIISPIISKINGSEKIDLEKYLNINTETIEVSSNVDTNKYIEEVYIEKLKTDIKTKLLSINYETEKINLEIETKDDNTYGSILNLTVMVNKKSEEGEKTIKINKVIIGENSEKTSKLTQEEINEIKKYLAQIYQIDEEKINVN